MTSRSANDLNPLISIFLIRIEEAGSKGAPAR
jgi:hypothetical protein